jgi:multisubunit Na+/H+ antiporter MnhG subunit
VDVNLLVAVLLASACGAVVIAAAGVLLSRTAYQRLHFLGPTATVGVVAVVAAVIAREGLGVAGIKAVLAGVILLVINPILTHATARAARVHERGHWEEDDPA